MKTGKKLANGYIIMIDENLGAKANYIDGVLT